eukprot:SAG31_NODE_1475_length_8204_cov_18.026280_5_plen_480_part_00
MDLSLSVAQVHNLQEMHGFYNIQGQNRQYRVHTEQPLGHGSAGTVFAGCVTDGPAAGRRVAVKVLARAKAESTPERREALRREVAVAGKLHHKNIVQLLDVVRDDQSIHLIMELASGGELFERVAERGRLPEREAAGYAWQILNAVAHCHSVSVCHRDLKLENVLLATADGADNEGHGQTLTPERVLLTDFGFSKDFGESLPRTQNVGTLMYMAPEILQYEGKPSRTAASAGHKSALVGELAADIHSANSTSTVPSTYDPCKVDAWSVGVILYVLVCGAYPFGTGEQSAGRSPLRTFKRIMSGEFDALPIDLSPACADLLNRSLCKIPEDRLSIDEMQAHPWFQGERTKNQISENDACLPPLEAESLSTMLAALGTADLVTATPSNALCGDGSVDGLTTSMASMGSCSSMLESSMDSLFDECDNGDTDWCLGWDENHAEENSTDLDQMQRLQWAGDMAGARSSRGGSPRSPRRSCRSMW